jgi:hypothetical protein
MTASSHNAEMYRIWLLLLGLIVLSFCGVVYAACLSWQKMGFKKRIAGVLLLTPHFLFILCIAVSLLYGHPAQGSHGFNIQFVCGVLIVFFLPLPALVCTVVAFAMFKGARM